MDENAAQQPAATAPAKRTWKQYLESEAATRFVYLVFGFIAIAMVLSYLQFRTQAICCGAWDGYYHIRWGQLLWESISSRNGLPTFLWLPLPVLDPEHCHGHRRRLGGAQIPVLWAWEPGMAAKRAGSVFATLAVFSVYWMLYHHKVAGLIV